MILTVLVRALLRSEAVCAMEIITGVERRRRWRLEEKLRIVAETERPGASFAAVARRHEISRGLLWNWRCQVRSGQLATEPVPTFLPVQVMAETSSTGNALVATSGRDAAPVRAERIEIALADGTCIRVGADVGLTTLRRVMAAVRR